MPEKSMGQRGHFVLVLFASLPRQATENKSSVTLCLLAIASWWEHHFPHLISLLLSAWDSNVKGPWFMLQLTPRNQGKWCFFFHFYAFPEITLGAKGLRADFWPITVTHGNRQIKFEDTLQRSDASFWTDYDMFIKVWRRIQLFPSRSRAWPDWLNWTLQLNVGDCIVDCYVATNK